MDFHMLVKIVKVNRVWNLPFVGSGITEGLSTSKSSRPHVTVILDFLTGSYFVQCKSCF